MKLFFKNANKIINMFLFYIFIYCISLIISSFFNVHVAYFYFGILFYFLIILRK
ncbi:hypothetical protein MHA_1522 [Mannheimia haemolytica PHL213]|nr:hypothetical protein MHA_1522 [Mannheimia haemolytica PHL213]EEY09481.1 hypothetical protein COI_1893 [Mannheimia haemolytica serotype A2 str. OVINE]